MVGPVRDLRGLAGRRLGLPAAPAGACGVSGRRQPGADRGGQAAWTCGASSVAHRPDPCRGPQGLGHRPAVGGLCGVARPHRRFVIAAADDTAALCGPLAPPSERRQNSARPLDARSESGVPVSIGPRPSECRVLRRFLGRPQRERRARPRGPRRRARCARARAGTEVRGEAEASSPGCDDRARGPRRTRADLEGRPLHRGNRARDRAASRRVGKTSHASPSRSTTPVAGSTASSSRTRISRTGRRAGAPWTSGRGKRRFPCASPASASRCPSEIGGGPMSSADEGSRWEAWRPAADRPAPPRPQAVEAARRPGTSPT